jgi:hypothetical protein
MSTSIEDLAAAIGVSELPTETNTVVETWMMCGDIKITIDRYVRANDSRWRRIEQRGDGNLPMTNEQVSIELALAQGWSIAAVPVKESDA